MQTPSYQIASAVCQARRESSAGVTCSRAQDSPARWHVSQLRLAWFLWEVKELHPPVPPPPSWRSAYPHPPRGVTVDVSVPCLPQGCGASLPLGTSYPLAQRRRANRTGLSRDAQDHRIRAKPLRGAVSFRWEHPGPEACPGPTYPTGKQSEKETRASEPRRAVATAQALYPRGLSAVLPGMRVATSP